MSPHGEPMRAENCRTATWNKPMDGIFLRESSTPGFKLNVSRQSIFSQSGGGSHFVASAGLPVRKSKIATSMIFRIFGSTSQSSNRQLPDRSYNCRASGGGWNSVREIECIKASIVPQVDKIETE